VTPKPRIRHIDAEYNGQRDTGRGNRGADLKRSRVVSSTIRSIGYDRRTAVLEIEFADGDLYKYFMVPRLTYQAFLEAPSKGRFFSESVRDRYQFQRL